MAGQPGRQHHYVIVCDDEAGALSAMRHFHDNHVPARVYRGRYVHIGPTTQPGHYFANGGPLYEGEYYEDAIEALIKGEKLDLSGIVR